MLWRKIAVPEGEKGDISDVVNTLVTYLEKQVKILLVHRPKIGIHSETSLFELCTLRDIHKSILFVASNWHVIIPSNIHYLTGSPKL